MGHTYIAMDIAIGTYGTYFILSAKQRRPSHNISQDFVNCTNN